MEQKTELQIAQELKEDWTTINSGIAYALEIGSKDFKIKNNIIRKKIIKQAESNLEGLGCGKKIELESDFGECGEDHVFMNKVTREFCHDCLAKGVGKAKAIYEGILK